MVPVLELPLPHVPVNRAFAGGIRSKVDDEAVLVAYAAKNRTTFLHLPYLLLIDGIVDSREEFEAVRFELSRVLRPLRGHQVLVTLVPRPVEIPNLIGEPAPLGPGHHLSLEGEAGVKTHRRGARDEVLRDAHVEVEQDLDSLVPRVPGEPHLVMHAVGDDGPPSCLEDVVGWESMQRRPLHSHFSGVEREELRSCVVPGAVAPEIPVCVLVVGCRVEVRGRPRAGQYRTCGSHEKEELGRIAHEVFQHRERVFKILGESCYRAVGVVFGGAGAQWEPPHYVGRDLQG